MEENQVAVIEEDKEKQEFKTFQISFLLFLIGEIHIVVSLLSNMTAINGVPQALVLFYILSYVGQILYFISLFRLRKINKAYFYSFIAFCIYLLLRYIKSLCEHSTQPSDLYTAKGLGWSVNFLQCIFYLYFFYGTHLFFQKHQLVSGAKNVRISLAVFACVFIITEVFEYLSTARFIRNNRFTNRFFLYGYWSLLFVLYFLVFLTIVLTWIYLRRQFKKKGAVSNG